MLSSNRSTSFSLLAASECFPFQGSKVSSRKLSFVRKPSVTSTSCGVTSSTSCDGASPTSCDGASPTSCGGASGGFSAARMLS